MSRRLLVCNRRLLRDAWRAKNGSSRSLRSYTEQTGVANIALGTGDSRLEASREGDCQGSTATLKEESTKSPSRPAPISIKRPVKSNLAPPLFWKAYALALAPYLDPSSDLSGEGKALFVAPLLTPGVPGGDHVQAAMMNEQLFHIADTIQTNIDPFFDFDGEGSYFDRQRLFLQHVPDRSRSGEVSRKSLDDALKRLNEAYETDFNRFKAALAISPSLDMMQWMTEYAFNYQAAHGDMSRVQNKILSAESTPLNDYQLRLNSMNLARSTDRLIVGNTMECTTIAKPDPSTSSQGQPALTAPNPTKIFYRPLHHLSSYSEVVNGWINTYNQPGTIPMELPIDLTAAREGSWASLGFPNLDELDTTANTALSALSNIKVSIQISSMQAFSITRGLWNIDGPRKLLPRLDSRAPPNIAQPFFKTTRLLLGYGVDIKIDSSMEAASILMEVSSDNERKTIPGGSSWIPFLNNRDNSFQASSPDNTFPVLLAVLAQLT